MLRGILLLCLVFGVFIVGVLFLDAVMWGKREGIVKRGYAGEDDADNDDI